MRWWSAPQVPNGGQHQSCCAVVAGCSRCVFFVPAPGTFAGADLARLEAEAAANPGARGVLVRHLHVRHPPTLPRHDCVSRGGRCCMCAPPRLCLFSLCVGYEVLQTVKVTGFVDPSLRSSRRNGCKAEL